MYMWFHRMLRVSLSPLGLRQNSRGSLNKHRRIVQHSDLMPRSSLAESAPGNLPEEYGVQAETGRTGIIALANGFDTRLQNDKMLARPRHRAATPEARWSE